QGHRDGPGRADLRALPGRVADERRGGRGPRARAGRGRDRLGEVHERGGGASVKALRLAAAGAALLALAACGSGSPGADGGPEERVLVVLAAASLTDSFGELA